MTSENIQTSRLNREVPVQSEPPILREAEENQPIQPRKWEFAWSPSDTDALKRNSPLLLFGALVLFSVATYIAYLVGPVKAPDDLLDYGAYAFPALAAVAAGLNVVVRREGLWFWVSATFVTAGFLLYIVKNHMLGSGSTHFVYLIGVIAIIVMVIVVSKLQSGRWKDKEWVSPLFGWLTIIFATVQCTLIISIDRQPPPPPIAEKSLNDMQCHKISGDLEKGLVLSCTN